MGDLKVAIVGFGVVGNAYHKMFPDALVYDPPKNLYGDQVDDQNSKKDSVNHSEEEGKRAVNACDVAIVAVFTPTKADGSLDVSVVEETIDWLETPLIIIKSALYPGTTDRLVEKTGKRIAVSVEYIGESNYPTHFWKFPHQTDPRLHQMLVVGGEESVASEAAEILWRKMSPDIKIHIVSALEAEITKLVENSQAALKVTFINTLMSLADATNTNFVRIHQAWSSDPRVESMHMRTVHHDRGWFSKCFQKDVPALATYAHSVGATDMARLFDLIVELNKDHLKINEGN